jgi:hypothetical protein
MGACAPLSEAPEGKRRMRSQSTLPDVKERLTGAYGWNHAILIISLSYPYFPRAQRYLYRLTDYTSHSSLTPIP